ncbi:ABC transporter substrate-binding protein [Bdellovibrio bacteriovorus]|uniref:Amino acid ABC transporter substrate-binding protein n=1 Tax=Bdellovibrio bacteriovorus TaxID=959 RepID=A0A150WCK1_BDEBC|nr:ABC transporter substrate-binding protein [Bdellovibrio bacteriovorus]KYG60582.1 amino acid ABC transporter substrate-binding protein [Bdellovibrio bacteriovorus]
MLYLTLVLSLFFSVGALAKPKVLTFITHEAPPHMSEAMPDHGAVFYSLKKVLEKKGYGIKVIFAPSWTRAKMNAVKDPKIDGLVPVRTIENTDQFIFTKLFYKSAWLIIERKDHPIVWNKISDLAKYTAGNIQGVELRDGIKELAEAGKMKIETVGTPLSNFLKVATKRVDFAFSDELVFRYTMGTEPELKPYQGVLQLNPKPIVIDRYGVALKKSEEAQAIVKHIELHEADFSKYTEEYLTSLLPKKP